MPAMETVPHADDIAADCRPGASAAGSDADFGVVMSSFGPPWKLALPGGVAVLAAVALLPVNWGTPATGRVRRDVFIGRGSLHVVTTSFQGVRGAHSALQGGGELGVSVLLLVWPHPTLLVVAVAVAVGTWVVVRAAVAGSLVLATRGDRRRWWVRFGADVIELALGVALIARLVDTVHAAALTLGAIAVRAGTIEIATAVIHMRRPRPASVEVNASPMGV
jgi:hypothetical protein